MCALGRRQWGQVPSGLWKRGQQRRLGSSGRKINWDSSGTFAGWIKEAKLEAGRVGRRPLLTGFSFPSRFVLISSRSSSLQSHFDSAPTPSP